MNKSAIMIVAVLLVLLAGLSALFLGGRSAGKSASESATTTAANEVNRELGDAGVPDTVTDTPSHQEAVTNNAPSAKSAPNTTASAPAPVAQKASVPQAQKRLVVRFVNQFGETIRGGDGIVEPQLYDSVGERVNGDFWGSGSNTKEGLREFDKDIAPGSYVVKWETTWLNGYRINGVSSVERKLDNVEAKITVPNNGNWAVTIPVQQKQISYFNSADIRLTLKNQAGTPLQLEYKDGGGTVINAQGKKTRLTMFRRSGSAVGDFVVSTGGFDDYLPGVYTLKIEKVGYKTKTVTYTLPDVSSWSDAEVIAKHPGVIDLGTVVLEKM